MNPVETFGEFAQKLSTTDLMLYAGVGLVLWVMFKDKLSPVQKFLSRFFVKRTPVTPVFPENIPSLPLVTESAVSDEDVFFLLVSSWKRTRDLAVMAGCKKAVEAADQMFPHLSPVTCKESKDDVIQNKLA